MSTDSMAPALAPDLPAIDLGPLPDLCGYPLRRAQIAVFQDFNRTFAQVDIRPAQYSVLTVIERNPGLKQSDIAAALGIKRTNFVALFNTLETRGLATREASPVDRRSHALHLTAKGAALMPQLHALSAQHEARIAEFLGTDNLARMVTLLHGVVAGLGAGEDDGE